MCEQVRFLRTTVVETGHGLQKLSEKFRAPAQRTVLLVLIDLIQ